MEDAIATATCEAAKHEVGAFVGGTSPAMLTLEAMLAEIAPTNIPVLLVGECGTGKQMFAQRIHQLSERSEPLIKVSCAGMRAESFASELGLDAEESEYRRNAGTVFFDEISELDSACQRYLLGVLPDGDGCARRGMAEARIVSTTNKNLDEEMRAGRFRSELYYRINGVCLRVPALRDRKEDIPQMVEVFCGESTASQLGRSRPGRELANPFGDL